MSEMDKMTQTPRQPDNWEKVYLYIMALDTINLEELGKDEGLVTYEKVWEASDLAHSINMPNSFQVGLFLEAIIRR